MHPRQVNDLHRHLFLLCGDAEWCRATACERLAHRGYRRVLWVGSGSPAFGRVIPAGKIASWLGSEWQALVFDAWRGFDADAFGAALGGVRGGGSVLLLTPPLEQWDTRPDAALERFTPWPYRPEGLGSPFLRRLAGIVSTSDCARLFRPGDSLPELPAPPAAPGETLRPTGDQRRAVDAICRVALGHRRRPLVLTADRGRGKSAALGFAAAQLLREGKQRILVTAPRRDAVAVLFRQAEQLLPGAVGTPGMIRWRGGWIRFEPPDRLCREGAAADLLLVDEAAAIPVPLLTTLLQRHSRIVFSTTVHGYEGTGRGFAIRFRETLERLTPEWRSLQLVSPVRWGNGDPVERFGFHALLLDASAAPDETMADLSVHRCEAVVLPRERLLADDSLLRELFGLLVLSHYRTRPSDLRNLLDGPTLSVHALLHRGHVAAAALVVEEGGLDEDLARAIWLGRRRVRGHLLPQSLAAHAGFPEAAPLRYARIMRLAVHPAARRRGLGSRLVRELTRHFGDRGVDAVGTSFGATPELLAFWYRVGFSVVHLGLRAEASSGHHAAFLLHPSSPAGERLTRQIRDRFRERLPTLLHGPLRHLEPETVARLLENLPPAPHPTPEEAAWLDIVSFTFGSRGYEMCAHAIGKLVYAMLTGERERPSLPVGERDLLILRVLQDRDWAAVAHHAGLAGRAAAVSALRQAVARVVQALPSAPHRVGTLPPNSMSE